MADGHGFYLAGNAWLSEWLHTGGRRALQLVAVILLVTACRPWGPWRRFARSELRWAIGTALACALLVAVLKQASQTSCPWDLHAFGGSAAYVPHWRPGNDGGPGRCFPAGHAAGAFALFSYYFLLASHKPTRRAAWICLVAVCALGAAFGLAQQLRGAHFTSHTLWSAWLCWFVTSFSWTARCRCVQRRACVSPRKR
nr:phosphatase PAP2 family protein [Lampropedia cohaerens]